MSSCCRYATGWLIPDAAGAAAAQPTLVIVSLDFPIAS
jgi:hypothetical protein